MQGEFQSANVTEKTYTKKDYWKFILPSLFGLLFFIIPINTESGMTVPVAYFANSINGALGAYIPSFTVAVITLSVLGSITARGMKPGWIMNSAYLKNLFYVSNNWLLTRTAGMVFGWMVLLALGPDFLVSDVTGGLLLNDLLPVLFTTFLLAGFLLPLLLNFGLLEFVGALLMKVMRPSFTLPGRSSLDCLASWVGDGTIGVLLTSKQYEEGYYTKRESAVVATTFSIVSITFTIVVITYLNMEAYFLPYYATIIIAGLAAAIIMPRIPPLSRKSDDTYEGAERRTEELIPSGVSVVKWGKGQALEKARHSGGAKATMKEGLQNVLDMWIGVMPVVMAIGTVAVVIAEFTSFFTIIGKPFEWLLVAMQVPEAGAAGQTMVVGFADMFLPAVIGSGIESEMTRFIIASVSVTQLVYMSEMGGLLLGSKLPVSFKDLVFIFLLRTLITLPIVVGIAHLIF
ncbi:YjiH family protein [Halobacillus litoralis]|uniref:YjiH family protein n=1 Tax=Halobacillus litoralis TaxID=45668 RepID=A0A845DWE1_9BACI|nr:MULTISPECIES: YjiH family protein [Halobacillus]MYL20795.1 YjiH family protein [Halobacillus litoralis]MYL30836.1 YjiH family protein [Halobacillus halophilus]MYL36357.1 YjiH family protein [Halobacillus litoralis]